MYGRGFLCLLISLLAVKRRLYQNMQWSALEDKVKNKKIKSENP